ncbi:hypothetical protein [Nocardia goodfellowii]|uniref:Uncharacterized protein n=1 Tax=Nocardia goodfellowii TaxID=882446 RepID=A0ABS4QMF4_9NOCA|nr:hypothetical protein [Nocardia goodfellowii]MBP2192887.1 hypothetical protein [Nocardia goodfellowii]
MASLDNRTISARPRQHTAEKDSETPIVWPDPSPLDSWWEQVMGRNAQSTRRSVA